MSLRNILIYLVVTIPVTLSLISCSREKSVESPIVARVGERVITADEFRYSYEFGFGMLKKGKNPRRIYLDYMIDELLLANEGFSQGLNKVPYVTKRLQRRKKNDMLEAYYARHVHSKVHIPEDKLQDAIKKSTVIFRLIIWPAPTLQEAEAVRLATRKSSLEDFIEKQIAQQEVKLSSKKSYETDWIDYLEMPPVVFNRIKDLPVGQTSEPFPYAEGYAVAEVLDINLQGITESQLYYGARRKNIKERLYNVQSDSIMHALMDSVLTPLDVRVKGEVVERLAPPLYQWYKDGLPEQRSIFTKFENMPDTAKSYLKEINLLRGETLLTYAKGEKTVDDYLTFMDYYRKALKENKSFEDFKNILVTEIGRQIMDETFFDLAAKEGFADSVNIVNDLKVWEEKWTYDVYRSELVKELDVTDQEMHDYFKNRYKELDIANVDTSRFYKYEVPVYNAVLYDKHMAVINRKLSELRKKYPVSINDDVLNSLELTESKKANDITLFARKKYSWEAVVPGLDIKWFNLNN